MTTDTHFADAWTRTTSRLDRDIPQWRDRVRSWGQTDAVEARARGRTWTDDEIFQGLLLSILSNNTRWERVERVRHELAELFHGFSLARYSQVDPGSVASHFIPWFTQRRASSTTLAARLRDLIHASRKLVARSAAHASVDGYLSATFRRVGRDAKQLALALSSGPDKLDGFGPALAAEALKNLGYDVAKPDRHVNRAVGMFGWVAFRKWEAADMARFAAPQATHRESLEVMTQMAAWAAAVRERVALVDNSLWLLCAGTGLHLTNDELKAAIGGGLAMSPPGRTRSTPPRE